MVFFENKPGEMIDILIENTKVNEFPAEYILDVLIKEKVTLNDYHTIKVTKVYEKFYRFNEIGIKQDIKYYQVHISCTHNLFIFSGTENIDDLPQKIRQRKLERILNS